MEPEAAVRQFYRALSTGDAGLLDEILADDWEDAPLPPGTGPGRENYKAQALPWMRTIFPDLVITNEDVIVSADGSKVAVRSVAAPSPVRCSAFPPPARGRNSGPSTSITSRTA